jgi:hypothetical protein
VILLGSSLVVVGKADFIGVAILPPKDDSPLIVDPNTEHARQIAL